MPSLSLADRAMAAYVAGGAPASGRSIADNSYQAESNRLQELAYDELAADFVTASAVDVDVTGLSITVTGTGRPILLRAAGMTLNAGANTNILTITDDANVVQCLGSDRMIVAATTQPFLLEKRITLAQGVTKTYKLRMRTSAGNGTLYATAPSTFSLSAVQL